MKQLQIFTGGHPPYKRIYDEDITHLNEALTETVQALASFLGLNFYLQNTAISTAVVGFDLRTTCAAGWMVYKGEPCQFDAQNISAGVAGTLVWKPQLTYRACDPVTYADGGSKRPHLIKKVVLAYVDTGTEPDYVAVTDMKQPGSALKGLLTDTWQAPGAVGSGFTAITGSGAPKYCKDDDLSIYKFKGELSSLTIGAAGPQELFQLNTGDAPARDLYGVMSIVDTGGGNVNMAAGVRLKTNGWFEVYMPSGVMSGAYNLDGVQLRY